MVKNPTGEDLLRALIEQTQNGKLHWEIMSNGVRALFYAAGSSVGIGVDGGHLWLSGYPQRVMFQEEHLHPRTRQLLAAIDLLDCPSSDYSMGWDAIPGKVACQRWDQGHPLVSNVMSFLQPQWKQRPLVRGGWEW